MPRIPKSKHTGRQSWTDTDDPINIKAYTVKVLWIIILFNINSKILISEGFLTEIIPYLARS